MTTDENNHSSVRAASITQPEVREKILDAAEKKFREHGYLKVTVADVAEDLDMSPANVYRFFESKAALREALVYRLTGQVEDLCAKVVHGEGTASEKLVRMILEYNRLTLDRYLSAPNAHEMLDDAMRENWTAIHSHTEKMRLMLRDLILEGVQSGDFKVRDAEVAARTTYYAIMPFIDPTNVALLFANDTEFVQVRQMSLFVLGALRSGCL